MQAFPLGNKTKYFLTSLAFGTFLVVVGSALFFFFEYSKQQQILSASEKQHIKTIGTVICQEAGLIVTDLQNLSKHEPLQEFATSNREASRGAVINGFSSFIRHNNKYDQVRFIGSDGKELVRINKGPDRPLVVPKEQLQDKSERYYFKEAMPLSQGKIYVSPLDLNIENKKVEIPFKPMLRVAAPFYDARKTLRGILVLNYLGKRLLDRLNMEAADISPVELLNSKGYWLKSKQPDQEWAFMVPESEQMTFAHKFPREWATIYSGRSEGQLKTDNGLFTFAAVTPFNELSGKIGEYSRHHWYLVSQVQKADLVDMQKSLLKQIVTIDILILLLLAPVCSLYAGYKQKSIKQIVLETANTELLLALEEIKTLRGTLPICASCKSIRDDEGYWSSIEKYICEHSDADLSHGLCPACMDRMYSGESWYETKKA